MSTAFTPVSNDDLAHLGTGPVPSYPYYDPEYFELEKGAIFKKSWMPLGHICELERPGDYFVRTIEMANASILVTRGNDGQIRAFHNACTHRGTQLVDEGSGNSRVFSCRYHRWTFGLDGSLKAAPDFERFFTDKASCALNQVHVEECEGIVFVNLSLVPEQTLTDWLGGAVETMAKFPIAKATAFTEYTYEVEGNWKTVCDNFQENYHVRYIHPKSIGGNATSEANPFGYPKSFSFFGPHRMQSNWLNPEFTPTPVLGSVAGELATSAMKEGYGDLLLENDYLGLFPNFFLFGSVTQMFTNQIWPLSPTRSRGVIRIYWRGADDSASQRFAREYAFAMFLDIHSEDQDVIESAQRGLSGGAIEKIHFQAQEVLCRHMYTAVDEAVKSANFDAALYGRNDK